MGNHFRLTHTAHFPRTFRFLLWKPAVILNATGGEEKLTCFSVDLTWSFEALREWPLAGKAPDMRSRKMWLKCSPPPKKKPNTFKSKRCAKCPSWALVDIRFPSPKIWREMADLYQDWGILRHIQSDEPNRPRSPYAPTMMLSAIAWDGQWGTAF